MASRQSLAWTLDQLDRLPEDGESWIVDGERRQVTVVRPGLADERIAGILAWHPHGAGEALRIDLAAMFHAATGPVRE